VCSPAVPTSRVQIRLLQSGANLPIVKTQRSKETFLTLHNLIDGLWPMMRACVCVIVADSCGPGLCRPGGACQRPHPVLHVTRLVATRQRHLRRRISHRRRPHRGHCQLIPADSLHRHRVELQSTCLPVRYDPTASCQCRYENLYSPQMVELRNKKNNNNLKKLHEKKHE